jgi:hypothetical protein
MGTFVSRAAWAALVLGALLVPATSFAIDRQLLVGGDLAFAYELADDGRLGGGAGAYGRYFLTDYIAVGANAGWSGLAATDAAGEADLRHVVTAAAGLFYYADYIRFVPYVGVMMGAAVAMQEETNASYLVQASLGGFVLATPAFTAGLDISYQLLVGEEILPLRLTVSIQLGWRHVFF